MAKETIAQLREKALDRLIAYRTDQPTEADYALARRLMNSYYRLHGLAVRNLILVNDSYHCNKFYTKQSEERESRWFKRLSADFEKEFGLILNYAGAYPDIYEQGGTHQTFLTYFYNE